MIVRSSLHNHSTLCDGISTPEEMAEAALAAGFTDLGFSSHSYAPFDPEYSVKSEAGYIAAIRSLQAQYAGRLRIWCGMEQDHFAPVTDRTAFDYIIGAVHYVDGPDTGVRYTFDGSVAEVLQAVEAFRGDAMAMVREYYRLLAETVSAYRPEIVAHFDVITKNNRRAGLFNETSAEYRKAALDALEACAAAGAIFEVNTGGMRKNHRLTPYPDVFLLERIRELGAPVMLSADCHDARFLTYRLAETAELLRALGFRSVKTWIDGRFEDMEL